MGRRCLTPALAHRLQVHIALLARQALQQFAQHQGLAGIEHVGLHVVQRIKVGLKIWNTDITGIVLRTERRRNGLHTHRNWDDKAFTDVIVLQTQTDGATEETSVTMDEFTRVERA